jgi:hypothetical protein
MQPNWAEENLQVIRTLMDRAAIYRRALAPIMIATGTLGLLGSMAGLLLRLNGTAAFIACWFGAAAIALIVAFLLARRQALQDEEPFWSRPTRRVAVALSPALLVGLMAGVLAVQQRVESAFGLSLLVLLWLMLYGCAIHSAGFFMPTAIRRSGWVFLGGAAVLLILLVARHQGGGAVPAAVPHLIMGAFFGLLQLGYGIYLRKSQHLRTNT